MTQNKTEQSSSKQETINNKAINALSDSEMNSLLAQLVESKYWHAILRYNRLIDSSAINSLASLDPFKEPTMVARRQGMRTGIYHIEQTAIREYENMKKMEEADAEKNK